MWLDVSLVRPKQVPPLCPLIYFYFFRKSADGNELGKLFDHFVEARFSEVFFSDRSAGASHPNFRGGRSVFGSTPSASNVFFVDFQNARPLEPRKPFGGDFGACLTSIQPTWGLS